MVSSKKCHICNKVCRKNQLFTSCSICKNLVHQKCTELPPRIFKELCTLDCPTPYACTNCFSESLPLENDNFCNPVNTDFLNDSDFDNTEVISKYYSMSDLNSLLTSKAQNDLFIMHLNDNSRFGSFWTHLGPFRPILSFSIKIVADFSMIKLDWQSLFL